MREWEILTKWERGEEGGERGREDVQTFTVLNNDS